MKKRIRKNERKRGKNMEQLIKDYEQIQEELREIERNCNIVKKREPIGYTQTGLPIVHYTIGEGNNHIVVEAGMHGCEIISVDFVLQLMNEIGKEKSIFSSFDFSKYQIHFLPLINPEGYIIATSAIKKILTKEMNQKEVEKICKSYYIRYRQDDIDSKKVMKEIDEIEDNIQREEAIIHLRKGIKYYQEMFQYIDETCIPDLYKELRDKVKKICENNDIPAGCLQIWSANGNGIDLAQNCKENQQMEEEYGELRYNNINQGKPGPIGCSSKEKEKFELEKENIALYQFVEEIEKKKENRICAYFSYHSTGGMIFYRTSEEKESKEEYNEKLAIEYAKETGYSLVEKVRKAECNEIKMRKKVQGHLLIELSQMGGNPISPYGDLENNYYPTIEKNIKAVRKVFNKIIELNGI